MASNENLEKLRSDAIGIFQSALRAVDPAKVIESQLRVDSNLLQVRDRSFDLDRFERILVVGAGKASGAMARAVEGLLGDRISDGCVNVKTGHAVPTQRVEIVEAGHPIPDAKGLEGTKRILHLLEKASERDLVLCLLSGGGSALLPCPADGVSFDEKQQTTSILLRCGATIHEINAIRKHISSVKGGNLARRAYPATLVTLILSDVVGDDLDSIASGPTVPDRSSFQDCRRILEKYGIENDLPPTVRRRLEMGLHGDIEETPKEGDPVFARTWNAIIANNLLAVTSAAARARELGYRTLVLSTMIEGETREVAKVHAAVAKEIRKNHQPLPPPACIISGGETTVTIAGSGLGGRNQEFVLAAALEIGGWPGIVVLSGGTDGTDGPTDAAGALADGRTMERALALGLDGRQFLRDNDSYHFFEALHDLLKTGPTLTNVMDLRLILAEA
ncbi:MAG: glycerate kinase [Acidobacteriota bacterium]